MDDFFGMVEVELRRLHAVVRRITEGRSLGPADTELQITPQQVDALTFKPTRLRVGYDEDQVDEFIDEVAREITAVQRFLHS